nr:hypothetical protein Q903MT_gene4605 [Picea sitchensis]
MPALTRMPNKKTALPQRSSWGGSRPKKGKDAFALSIICIPHFKYLIYQALRALN